MSISAGVGLTMPEILAWGVLALLAGGLVAIAAIVLRRGSVAGPMRVPPQPGALQQLAGVTAVGLAAWLLIPSLFAAALRDAPPSPATPATAPVTAPSTEAPIEPAPLPTTAPAIPPTPPMFSPQQTVIVSIVGGLGGGAALVLANLMFRPGGLTALGFGFRFLPRGLVIGIAAALLVLPLTMLTAAASDWLWRLIRYDHPGAHEMLRILGETQAPTFRALIYISAILVAPLFEELLFRGHIQTLLVEMFASGASADRRPALASPAVRWVAILLTSVFFTLVHAQLWLMPPIFFLSLCLGYAYERTANLWVPIVVHMMFNLTNVVLFMTVAAR